MGGSSKAMNLCRLPAKVRASVATRKTRRGPGALGTRVGSIHAGGAQGDRWQPTESCTTVPTVASYALTNQHPRSSWCFRRLSTTIRGQTISTPSPFCVEAHENRPTYHPTNHPTRMLQTIHSDDFLSSFSRPSRDERSFLFVILFFFFLFFFPFFHSFLNYSFHSFLYLDYGFFIVINDDNSSFLALAFLTLFLWITKNCFFIVSSLKEFFLLYNHMDGFLKILISMKH